MAGVARPATPKPVAVTEIIETETSPVPPLFSVTVWVPFEPTVTFPKLTVVGVALNCGCVATTVPLNATGAELVPSELARAILPLAAPAVVPLSQIRKLALCPASSVMGMVIFDSVNSVFEKLA